MEDLKAWKTLDFPFGPVRAAAGFEQRRFMVKEIHCWFRNPHLIRMSLSGNRPYESETISKLPQQFRHKQGTPGAKAV